MMPKIRLKRLLASATLALSWLGSANAATTVTTSQAFSNVFSQDSFGSQPITIRWLAPITLQVDASLLAIENQAELDRLFSLAPDGNLVSSVFFVTSIGACNGVTDSFQGCAQQPGHALAVDADFVAAESDHGLILISHELGHNFKLGHVTETNTNLMLQDLTDNTRDLTPSQVSTIRASNLVIPEVVINGIVVKNVVTLRPIALTAVPEPASALLLLCGLGVAGAARRLRAPE
jgi:hypothetical protein